MSNEPKQRRSPDPEVDAMRDITRAIESLDAGTRVRVAKWVGERWLPKAEG